MGFQIFDYDHLGRIINDTENIKKTTSVDAYIWRRNEKAWEIIQSLIEQIYLLEKRVKELEIITNQETAKELPPAYDLE